MTDKEKVEALLAKAMNEGDLLYTLQNWDWDLPQDLRRAARSFTNAAADFENELDAACEDLGIERDDFY
jgi:hypothetical protein